MARHRRSQMRGFGALSGVLSDSVKGTDVLLGGLAGLAGIAAGKWAWSQLSAMLTAKGITVPEIVGDLVPAVGAAAGGVGAFYALKKSPKGAGLMTGAITAGLVVTGGGLAAKYGVPGFSDVVSVNLKGLVSRSFSPSVSPLGSRPALGLVTNDPRRQGMGMIAASPRPSGARQLGMIAPNARAKLSRISGIRQVDI